MTTELKQTPFRLPEETRDKLELYAAVSGKSMNSFVVGILDEAFREYEKNPEFKKKLKAEIGRRQRSLRKLKGGK